MIIQPYMLLQNVSRDSFCNEKSLIFFSEEGVK